MQYNLDYYAGTGFFSDTLKRIRSNIPLSTCTMLTGLGLFSTISIYLLYHYVHQKIHCAKETADCHPKKVELVISVILLTLITLSLTAITVESCQKRRSYTELNNFDNESVNTPSNTVI